MAAQLESSGSTILLILSSSSARLLGEAQRIPLDFNSDLLECVDDVLECLARHGANPVALQSRQCRRQAGRPSLTHEQLSTSDNYALLSLGSGGRISGSDKV